MTISVLVPHDDPRRDEVILRRYPVGTEILRAPKELSGRTFDAVWIEEMAPLREDSSY